jgi:spoIIIJ-associated protein
MKKIEAEGKTVNEAVESALKQLGLRRDQVEVQIIQEGSSGILGFGAKPARVKIVEKRWGAGAPNKSHPAPPRGHANGPAPRRSGDYPPAERPLPREEAPRRDPAPASARKEASSSPRGHRRPEAPRRPERSAAPKTGPLTAAQIEASCLASQELLKEILALMLFEGAQVSARWDAEQERVKAAIETGDHARLIGPEGRTLESLQFLITLMVGRRLGSPIAVQVDTQRYWESRENALLSEVRKGVETVRETGKPFRMPPMDAQLRRLIHRSLADNPDIVTSSEGDGAWRKIVLRPSK